MSSVVQRVSLNSENLKSSPTSVSHLKTGARVFDPGHGPEEPNTNKNANEKRKDWHSTAGSTKGTEPFLFQIITSDEISSVILNLIMR